jgi:Secretion system C-terminal sorting domain
MASSGGLNYAGVVFSYAIPASIYEVTSDSEFVKLFPNPNNGIFTIKLSGIGKQGLVAVYNVLGENVLTESLRSAQGDNLINLTNQPNGVYFYRVLSETGGLIGEGKLIT